MRGAMLAVGIMILAVLVLGLGDPPLFQGAVHGVVCGAEKAVSTKAEWDRLQADRIVALYDTDGPHERARILCP